MVGALDGRIIIITGAGQGLGREHALYLAGEGGRIVVNDVDGLAADGVVSEITAAGGEALVNHDDVASWDGGQRLIESTVSHFGALDVLVNNAGFLRDRALVNMSEAEWDDVLNVHLKGHFVPTRWAAAYWREEAKAGRERQASLINTSSTSGLMGNPGQTNYGAAKAGVAAFSNICAQELSRYGVRTNCIAPAARTRLTESTPGLSDMVAAPEDGSGFDLWDPANVSPVVALLASSSCPFNGRTLFVQGGAVRFMEGWRMTDAVEQDERWGIDELAEALAPFV